MLSTHISCLMFLISTVTIQAAKPVLVKEQALLSMITVGKVIGYGSQECYKMDIKDKQIRFEVLKYRVHNGIKGINSGVIIGGASGSKGENPVNAMKLEPSTKYKFSFEIKGTIPKISLKFISWGADAASIKNYFHGRQVVIARPTWAHPTEDWIIVNGTFKTLPNTDCGVIWLQVWASEKYGLNVKPGQNMEIRNFVLKKKVRRKAD